MQLPLHHRLIGSQEGAMCNESLICSVSGAAFIALHLPLITTSLQDLNPTSNEPINLIAHIFRHYQLPIHDKWHSILIWHEYI
jgi:hypothetical protein